MEGKDPVFEREIRSVADIKRWSIVKTHRDQSVAEHTFNVAMYVNDICAYLKMDPDFYLNTLQMTLWHDVDEIFTGDMPGPAKRALTHKKSSFKEVIDGWMSKIFGNIRQHRDGSGMSAERDNLAHMIIKVADELDAACEMAAEFAMGNKHAQYLVESRQSAMLTNYELMADLAGPRLLDPQRRDKLRSMLVVAVVSAAEANRAPMVFGE
jgi:5'-deoxynucleotidase YfbR-like HD superfamily hydrolase